MPPAKRRTAAKSPARKSAAKKAPARRTTAKKAPARKSAAKKASPRKAAAAKKAPARKAPAKKAGARRRTAAPRDLQTIRPVGFAADREFWDQRCRTTIAGDVTVHCGDLSGPIVEFIDSADALVGCVAWLTSKTILSALARRPGGVALCVQKEKDLRPGGDRWSAELRRRYLELPSGPLRRSMPAPLCDTDGPSRVDPVRCVGYLGGLNSPNMHHKFLVAGRVEGRMWVPERVWTGSFNFSVNAAASAENAVVIDDPVVASAYLAEFARIAAISEPLAWTSRVAKPDLRRRAA